MKRNILIIALTFAFLMSNGIIIKADDEIYSDKVAEEGFITKIKKLQTEDGYPFNYNDMVKVDDLIFVVGYLQMEYTTIPSLICFENGLIKYKKQLDEFEEGQFKSCIYENGYFYLAGTYLVGNDYKPFMYKIKTDGEAYYTKILPCDGETLIADMFLVGQQIYLFACSYGTNIGDFAIGIAKCSICLVELNLQFEINTVTSYGNDNRNSIYKVVHYNEMFYMYCLIAGTGSFEITQKQEQAVLVINYDKEVISKYSLPTMAVGMIDIVVIKDEVLLINKPYAGDIVEVYKLKDGTFEKSNQYNLQDKLKNTSIVKFINGEEKLIGIFYGEQNNSNYFIMCYFEENGYEEFEFTLDQYALLHVLCCDEKSFTVIYEIKGITYGYDFLCVKEKDELYYFNDEQIDGIIDNLDFDKCGRYKGILRFEKGEFVVYINGVINIPLEATIKDKSIYDCKIVLSANGEMYLNSKKIENGYLLEEDGTYILEVIGNDCKYYLLFTVEKIAIDVIKKEIPTISELKIKEDVAGINNVSFTQNHQIINISNVRNNVVIITFVTLVFMFIGFIIPRIKGRRRKYD